MAFGKYIKTYLAPGVIKSVLDEAFIKSLYKSHFLDLVKSDFLDLAKIEFLD